MHRTHRKKSSKSRRHDSPPRRRERRKTGFDILPEGMSAAAAAAGLPVDVAASMMAPMMGGMGAPTGFSGDPAGMSGLPGMGTMPGLTRAPYITPS